MWKIKLVIQVVIVEFKTAKQLQIGFGCTYFLVKVLASLHADDGGNRLGFLRSDCVVQELRFHRSIIFDVRWLVHAPVECLGAGGESRLAIGLSVYVLRLDASNVSSVSCRTAVVSSNDRLITYLEFAFLAPSFAEHLHRDPPLKVCGRCTLGYRSWSLERTFSCLFKYF